MSSLQPTPPQNGKPSIATLNLQAAIQVQTKWKHPRADFPPLVMELGDHTDTGTPFLFYFFRANVRRLPKARALPRGGTSSVPPLSRPSEHADPHVTACPRNTLTSSVGNHGDRITHLFSPPSGSRCDWMLVVYARCTVRRLVAEERAASRDVMSWPLVSASWRFPIWAILDIHVRFGWVRSSPLNAPFVNGFIGGVEGWTAGDVTLVRVFFSVSGYEYLFQSSFGVGFLSQTGNLRFSVDARSSLLKCSQCCQSHVHFGPLALMWAEKTCRPIVGHPLLLVQLPAPDHCQGSNRWLFPTHPKQDLGQWFLNYLTCGCARG